MRLPFTRVPKTPTLKLVLVFKKNSIICGARAITPIFSIFPRLEKLLATQGQKPHTGGRQKGSLSQTPNAIRKRAARAEMPAVFKSNRR